MDRKSLDVLARTRASAVVWVVTVGSVVPACAGEMPARDSCTAATIGMCIEACLEQFPGAAAREQRHACFDAAEREASLPAAPAAAARGIDDLPLAQMWKKPDRSGFEAYRPSYVIETYMDSPNDAPTSPNPANVVPATRLKRDETDFQFSMKAVLVPDSALPWNDTTVWFGYTQRSFWQMFDAATSRPFRESNYEPEIFVSHRFWNDATVPDWRLPLFVNAGLVHQSNGQSDPRSRSWNRAYAQAGFGGWFSDGASYAVLVRPWVRFHESAANDNNPDITHFLGYGDIEWQYWSPDRSRFLSVLARIRALQLDYALPRPKWLGGNGSDGALKLHLHAFTGYGESLIDYNQRHTTLGIGLSVPYGP